MKLKILGAIAKWLFALCMPFLLLTASLAWAVNSHWLYNYGFNKYALEQTPSLAELDLEEITDGLISYFNSDEEYINYAVTRDGEKLSFFTAEEIIHFKDVKELIRVDYWVLGGTLAYVLAYAAVSLFWRQRRYLRQLAWALVSGACLTLGSMLLLGLGVLLNFDQLFLQLHFLGFTNPFWLTRGYMSLLFTGGFFYDATLLCAIITASGAVVLGGIGGGYLIANKGRA